MGKFWSQFFLLGCSGLQYSTAKNEFRRNSIKFNFKGKKRHTGASFFEIKTTYRFNLVGLSRLVVNRYSFWLLLMIRMHKRRKIKKQLSTSFPGPPKVVSLDIAVKVKLLVLQNKLKQQNNSKVISISQFSTLNLLKTGPGNLLFLMI